MDNDYIDVKYFSPSGIPLNEKVIVALLPDIYIVSSPIELLEFYYSSNGTGHRITYSHKKTFPVEFTVVRKPSSSESVLENDEINSLLKGKLHKHDYFELVIVVSEELEMQIESQICTFNKGDVCILNRSTRHTEIFKPEVKVCFLTISPEYLLNWPQEDNLNLQSNFVVRKFLSKCVKDNVQQNKDYMVSKYLNKTEDSPIHKVILDIKKEFEMKNPGYQFFIRGLIYRLFNVLAEPANYKTDYVNLGFDNGSSLALSVKQLLDKSKKRMTKQSIADQLNYSSEHINRVFKKHYGQTIPEYNKTICVRHAASLLRSTNYDIHKICKQLGFVNRTHFYNLFRQEYGCSPAEYRKNSIMK